MENKVAVYRKTGYAKITHFNIVTFSTGESKVIKIVSLTQLSPKLFGLNILCYHMYVKKDFTLIDAVAW